MAPGPSLTPTGHERAAFAAMHGFDLLCSAWSLGLQRRESRRLAF
jgi:hypothetical protein